MEKEKEKEKEKVNYFLTLDCCVITIILMVL